MLIYTEAAVQALKASSVVDKVKGLLPFQTLPIFDLANDTADLGPNEVTKDSIKDVADNVKDGIDTASPGAAWTCTISLTASNVSNHRTANLLGDPSQGSNNNLLWVCERGV